MLFYKTYLEESNINRKPPIWTKDKIIMKFEKKNRQVSFWAKCTKTPQKFMKSVILQNLFRREISTGNLLSAPKIR